MTDSKAKHNQPQPQPQQQPKRQSQSKTPPIPQSHQDELDFLKKNLFKKIYLDLFQRNAELFKENDMTFEHFIYEYHEEINKSLDISKPNYPELLERIDAFIKKDLELKTNPLTKDINPLELKKAIMEKSKEDEWALIQKYQTALYQESQKKSKKDKEEKEKIYLNALSTQIKAKSETKNLIEEKKDSVYSYSANQKQKALEQEKKANEDKLASIKPNHLHDAEISEFISSLEKDNAQLDEENRKVISLKIDALSKLNEIKEEEQGVYRDMLARIIKEKRLENIQTAIKAIHYKKELDTLVGMKVNKAFRPDKMNDEERKFNKKLLEDSRKYFNAQAE